MKRLLANVLALFNGLALAVHSARHGDNRRLIQRIFITIGLGVIFLAIKFTEYAIEYHDQLVPVFHFSQVSPHGEPRPPHLELFMTFYFIMTAFHALHTVGRLQPGEWVHIWGIGSGVSTAALAIAKALGARTIVTSSSDAKLVRAVELGADVVVNHATGDVKATVKDATAGHGADVVVEHVGEATWRTSLDVAAREGRIVVCGATTGPNPPAALHRVWWKQLSILGSTMGTGRDFQGAYDLIAAGRARPVVDEVFPLSDIRAAHERLEAGEQLGKIVLAIPE